MARARPIPNPDPDAPLFVQAALIIGTRLNEMLEYERTLEDPEAVYELHQMRIAAKRLRYTLESFQKVYATYSPFGKEFDAAIETIKALQEHLGEIHDADVLVPRLTEHLVGMLKDGYGKERHGEPRVGVHFVDFEAGEGVLTLCRESRAVRDARYALLLQDWKALKQRGFFERLQGLLRAAITEDALSAVLQESPSRPKTSARRRAPHSVSTPENDDAQNSHTTEPTSRPARTRRRAASVS